MKTRAEELTDAIRVALAMLNEGRPADAAVALEAALEQDTDSPGEAAVSDDAKTRKAVERALLDYHRTLWLMLDAAGAPTVSEDGAELPTVPARIEALGQAIKTEMLATSRRINNAVQWTYESTLDKAAEQEEAHGMRSVARRLRDLKTEYDSGEWKGIIEAQRRLEDEDVARRITAASNAAREEAARTSVPVDAVREVAEDLLLTAENIASVEPENPAGLIRSAVTEFARRLGVTITNRGVS